MSYIYLPPTGSIYWSNPVNALVDLPAADTTGTVRLVKNLGILYWFNGVTWESTQDASPVSTLSTATVAANTTTGIGATGTYGAVTSLSLGVGFWQIQGQVGFNENGAAITSSLTCGISDSATGVGISEFNTSVVPFILGATIDPMLATPVVYANLAVTTTYYLNSRFSYTSGTPQHRGRLQARLL